MPRISCKTCRRLGEKLCSRATCALTRKPYPPGVHGAKRRRAPSEYGRQLQGKQKIAHLYGVRDTQLRRYVEAARKGRGHAIAAVLAQLEGRLDNVAFRLGFAPSPASARQLASHGHFLVNGKRITIPSYRLRPGDAVGIRKNSRLASPFQGLEERLKKHVPPPWLGLDRETMTGSVLRTPSPEDAGFPTANIQAAVQYYSR